MSSIVTIGFLDRTRVCLRTEFTPPLADDEHRELLIHAALLTGRAFAALAPERQGAFAGVLREWIAERFAACPLQAVDADPMACPHRFASTFLAPVREYALATTGCRGEAGGTDYFLPMGAAAYLRHVAMTDRDPEELLKPVLALCAAVAIHPVTVDNHFKMAAASIPKIGSIVVRTESAAAGDEVRSLGMESKRRLLESRRSLIVSACLAALLIILGVQYLSTREPQSQSLPKPPPPPAPMPSPPAPTPAPVAKPAPVLQPVVSAPAPKPLSPQARRYLRQVRDLSENSLAQVEVMLAAADRQGTGGADQADTLDSGVRRLQAWRRQFAALDPPRALTEQHREVGQIIAELERVARTIRAAPAQPVPDATRERLSALHDELARALNDAEAL